MKRTESLKEALCGFAGGWLLHVIRHSSCMGSSMVVSVYLSNIQRSESDT